ncbi:MAG: hypothetical protein ABJA11_10200, partial [Pseudolysinimonas sp.]
MSAATLASPLVSEFATAVRSALSDLSPEEVDDLTDGLEADLTDRLAESDAGELDAVELGDPAAYAEELRTAAGLPHRATSRTGWFTELRKGPGIIAHDVRAFVAAHPALARLRDFFVAIRPVWWVFRALALTALFTITIGRAPITGYTVVVAMVTLVLSVQFGRGKWLPFAWMRALLLALNVVLVIAVPFVLAGWVGQLNDAYYNQQYFDSMGNNSDMSANGLTENGYQVTNIFAYDAQGNPLTHVQLYDQDGKPLNLSGNPGAAYDFGDDSTVAVPSDAVTGRLGWNIFPLDHVNQSAIGDNGTIKSTAHRIPAELPFAT